MIHMATIASQVEQVTFPSDLPVNAFSHRVRSVDFHLHAAFELLLVLSGRILLYTDGGKQQLNPGDLERWYTAANPTRPMTLATTIALRQQVEAPVQPSAPSRRWRSCAVAGLRDPWTAGHAVLPAERLMKGCPHRPQWPPGARAAMDHGAGCAGGRDEADAQARGPPCYYKPTGLRNCCRASREPPRQARSMGSRP